MRDVFQARRRMDRRERALLLSGVATLLLLAGSGCAPFYLVRSHFVEASHDEPPPEITVAPGYERGLRHVRKVAIRSRVAHGDVTPLAAARELGAQVLFQINSLERSTLDPGRSAFWERHYYRSSSKGCFGFPSPCWGPEVDLEWMEATRPSC